MAATKRASRRRRRLRSRWVSGLIYGSRNLRCRLVSLSLSLSHADLVATNNSLTSFKYLCPEASVLKSTRCSSKALSGERYKTAGTSPGISIRTCRERPWNKKLTTTNKIPRRNCRSVSSYLLQSWALRYDDNLQPARHDSSWDKSFFFCDLS